MKYNARITLVYIHVQLKDILNLIIDKVNLLAIDSSSLDILYK